MKKLWIRAVATTAALGLVVGAVALAATGTTSGPSRPVRALGANGSGEADTASGLGGAQAKPVEGNVASPHRTASASSLASEPPTTVPWVKKELRIEPAEEGFGDGEARPAAGAGVVDQADEALQTDRGLAGQMPVPDFEVAGLGSAANPFKLVPPDTNGDVGGGYYLQMVNVAFSVFDADDGTKISPEPIFMSSLFDPGPQKLCATHDDGDPIVVYDDAAQVWVISQFALNFNKPRFAECIAVSESSDPTGAWNAYQFDYPNPNVLNDYPKFGVWPAANNSAYFASFNQFRCSTSVCDFAWRGGGAVGYDRDAMIAGDDAGQVYFNLYPVDPALGGQLPSDADGARAPPADSPNYFIQFDADDKFWGYPDDQLEVWEFVADFADPSNSTFEQQTIVPTANFNPWPCKPGKLACVPQKQSQTLLDALSDRLMFRLQYRNFGGGDQRMVVVQTVRVPDKRSGIRWYQLTDTGPGGDWAIADQGTYASRRLEAPMDGERSDGRRRQHGDRVLDLEQGHLPLDRDRWTDRRERRRTPSTSRSARSSRAPGPKRPRTRRTTTGGATTPTWSWRRTAARSTTRTQYYKKTGQWKWATRIVRFQLDPARLHHVGSQRDSHGAPACPGPSCAVRYPCPLCDCPSCSCRRCATTPPTQRSRLTACCCGQGSSAASRPASTRSCRWRCA